MSFSLFILTVEDVDFGSEGGRHGFISLNLDRLWLRGNLLWFVEQQLLVCFFGYFDYILQSSSDLPQIYHQFCVFVGSFARVLNGHDLFLFTKRWLRFVFVVLSNFI